MLPKFFISLLLIVSFHAAVVAQQTQTQTQKQEQKQDTTAPETQKEKKVDIKFQHRYYSTGQFFHETGLFAKKPFHWIGRDWLRAGIVTAGTFAAMSLDHTLQNATQGQQRYYYSPFIVGGRVYGEWYSIGGVAAVFQIYGIIAHDTAAKKISIELFQGGVYAEFATTVLKFIIGRERPIATTNSMVFKPLSFKYIYESMPSGHTTSAFALSTIMSRHAHSTFLKILAYVPAGFTMFSRIYQDQHWLSDEVPAAAIGFFVGNWVVDLHEGKRHKINVPFTP
jgi:membrane-associated phospholipid phosphatase